MIREKIENKQYINGDETIFKNAEDIVSMFLL